MKKRVLLSLLAMASFVGASAYDKDQYVYTNIAKVKTTAPNAVTNGSFTDAFEGFDNGTDGGAVSNEAWEIVEAAGPNQENVLQCNKSASGYELSRVWKADGDLSGGGLYVISYMVKGTEDMNTIVNVKGNAGYYGFFVNQDGTRETVGRQVSDGSGFGKEWTVINDTVLLTADDYLVMYFDRVAEGACFTNFSINKCNEVFDERLATNKMDYLKGLINSGNFSNGQDILDENLPYIEGILSGEYATDPDDPDEMQACLELIDETTAAYLDANAASIVSSFNHWSKYGKLQKASQIGDWVFTGGRIFHINGNDEVDRVDHEYPGSYDLGNASGTVTKETTGAFGPGKYLIKMDVLGFIMVGTSAALRYNPNVNYNLKGIALFGGDQRLELDSVPTQRYRTFYMFYDVPEGATENIFGWDYTFAEELVGKKLGGQINFSNFDIRRVGVTKAELDHMNLVASIATAQNSLKVMLDSAKVVAAKTDIYKWGMAQLNDSITAVNAIYQASLLKVDADGNEVAVDDLADADLPTVLDNAMKQVRKAFQNVYGYCQPYLDLVEKLAEVEDNLNQPSNANGDAALKAELEKQITTAKNLIATYSAIDDHETILAEAAKYTELLPILSNAALAYFATTATYASPSAVDIVNGDFATGNTSGWIFSETIAGKENFKKSSNDSYSNGLCVAVGRGYTASPQSKLVQDVKLTTKGMYMYKARAHAFNVIPGNDLGQAEIIAADEENGIAADTIYICDKNKVHLIFGPAGAEDSVAVHSRMIEYNYSYSKSDWNGQQDYGYEAGTYVVFSEKSDDAESDYELGMYTYGQIDGAGSNIYGFGDNSVLFIGDAAKAFADVKADVAARLAADEVILEANKGSEVPAIANQVSRLSRRLASAKALAAGSVTTTKELSDLVNATYYADEIAAKLETIITGINTVKGDVVKMNIANGVYNLNGVKVANSIQSLNNLPAGLYIFNNKKYVVK